MANRSDILVNGSIEELLDQPSEIFGNNSNFLINGSIDELQDHPSGLPDAFDKIGMFSRLVIIPVSVVLNILCLIIFVLSKISQSPTGLTLTYLAIALSMFGTEVLHNYINIPSVPSVSYLVCQGNHFLLNSGFLLSGLLLAYSTTERYVSVRFALQVKLWNLYFKTKIIIVVFIITASTLSSFAFFYYDIIPLDIDRCLPSHKYEQFCSISEIFVNTVLSNGLCTLLTFIFTILTSIELFEMKKKQAEMGKESTNEFSITVMLVTVATLFLILRIPEMILFQMMSYFISNNMAGPVVGNVFVAWPLSVTFVIVNHSINFIIYIIFLRKFRDTFFSFFTFIKLKCVLQQRAAGGSDISSSVNSEITKRSTIRY